MNEITVTFEDMPTPTPYQFSRFFTKGVSTIVFFDSNREVLYVEDAIKTFKFTTEKKQFDKVSRKIIVTTELSSDFHTSVGPGSVRAIQLDSLISTYPDYQTKTKRANYDVKNIQVSFSSNSSSNNYGVVSIEIELL